MLTLKNIGKDYAVGQSGVHALRCINLVCRPRELIMVVGPNGSGKTTLLNILGARLPFSRGELLLNGVSTRKYADEQWSAYRRCVALVDSELLLPERTLLENAALGLRLSGGRRAFRREQALEMLRFFGLESLADRYPEELSSSQKKLGALACALTAEPDVLLVDEPVLGLDASSAKKVAGILRETARHCLVITAGRKPVYPEGDVRTIHLKDGMVESDSDPCTDHKAVREHWEGQKGLPFGGALSMAFTQLRRPSARGISRSVTGFIAAFCTAFVLISTGAMLIHSEQVQQNTLSVYPIHISGEDLPADELREFHSWLSAREDLPHGTEIQPAYDTAPWVFMPDAEGKATQVNPTPEGVNLWTEIPEDPALRNARFQLVSGRWPERYDEVVVIQNVFGTYSSAGLKSMGVQPDAETGEWIAPGYDSLLHSTFRLVLPVDAFYPNADGTWGSLQDDPEYMASLMERVPSVKIVGILRPAANTADTREDVFIGFTRAMTDYIADGVAESELVVTQTADPAVDVLTGLPFDTQGLHSQSVEQKAGAMLDHLETLDEASLRLIYQQITGHGLDQPDALQALTDTIASLSAEEAASLYDTYVASMVSSSTYEENMERFGALASHRLTELRLYAPSLEARQQLSALLDEYTPALNYSDDAENMVASAAAYAQGLKTLRVLLCAAAAICGIAVLWAVHSGSILGRRKQWAHLRGHGMSRRELLLVCLWESLLPGLLSTVLGIGAAWLLTGPLCRLTGWPQLAACCTLTLWHGAVLALLMLMAGSMAAVITASFVSGAWPGEMLQKGKE